MQVDLLERPRRNRRTASLRAMLRESTLAPSHLVMPCFVREGCDVAEPISSLPGQDRLSIDRLVREVRAWKSLGILAVAPFPLVDPSLKNARGTAAFDPSGLACRAVAAIKEAMPDLVVIADVALDPYTDHGHDGVLDAAGEVDNDATVESLCAQACVLAAAGADLVAPSDMMDGRVGALRRSLDADGKTNTGILSYCAKYASAFYGPFRDALGSAPRKGDKSGYQMDPSNRREALREARLDVSEGADILMVKPGLLYLDVLADLRAAIDLPLAAYHVSGEYAMLKAAAERGWLDFDRSLIESLLAFRRAGADFVLTYGAIEAARLLG